MRRAFGLRTRLLLALVVTALVTLVAAALALFGPLQDRLRSQQSRGLEAAARTARPQVSAALRKDLTEPGAALGDDSRRVLGRLTQQTGALVLVFDGAGMAVYGVLAEQDDRDDVLGVLGTGEVQTSRREDLQRIALPLNAREPGTNSRLVGPFFVLALRQQDTDVAETVDEVRRAFAAAAIAGLFAALVLGLVLTTTLTRRLGRLRDAALRITTDGTDAPTPLDDGADEIGDLGRAMARMQAGLQRQERARRQFVATASHELRTPLTSMSGNLELLGEDLADEGFDRADARRQVDAARGELRRLSNLATELLDLSRLDAGVALRSEPVELGEVARAVAAEFALRAHDRRSLLEVLPPRGPCWARGDPDAVARVARILLDNALRYTPSGTAIRIATGYAGDGATLAVLDDGPGVPEAEREAIFERFRRGSATSTEGGFGLGLAIGRELAERMEGGLDLEAAPDGARFVLTLPIELPQGGE